MTRFLWLVGCCLIAANLNAQNGTVSPYSFFGVGDIRIKGTVENQMMGGLQQYQDSIHLNLRNPAALAKLRLTTYTAAGSYKQLSLKDQENTQTVGISNFDYLAIAFPVSPKAAVAFGLEPFSAVGYELSDQSINVTQDTVTNLYSGSGGVNRVFLSVGAEPIKNFSVGATMNYNFGTLEYNRAQTIQNVQLGTLDNRTSRINGFDFILGFNYATLIKDKHLFNLHFGADTQVNLVSENTEVLGSFAVFNNSDTETIEVNLDAQNLRNTEIKIPPRFTYGIGYGEERKWFLGLEYATQALSSFSNVFLRQDNVSYTNASAFAFGGYYIPNYRALSGVFNRITYRGGLRYEQTGLVVNDTEIKNFGIAFGFGVPLGTSFSNLNIGFELGRQGTTTNNLIEENYFKLNIGLSLNDRWFIQRRIN